MIRWLDSLLVFFLVYQSGILPVGNNPITVTGEKGGNVTLLCEFKNHNILHFELHDKSKNIVCQDKECTDQYVQKGACDVIIKDLIFSNAGKYTLIIYYDDPKAVLDSKIKQYHIHIHGNISAEIGKPLKLDVLLINADKVEKNSNGEWTEVWKRGHGVRSDRLTDSDGNLTIKAFMGTDAGTYRVLDSKGEIWVNVTVIESGSNEEQRNTENNTKQQEPNLISTGTDTKHQNWIWPVVGVVVVAVVVVLIIFVLKNRPHQNSNTEHRNCRDRSECIQLNNGPRMPSDVTD